MFDTRPLKLLQPISTAILPVNEHNFFCARRETIGNMSVREAFGFAEEIGIDTSIPVHWNMLAANSVDLDEIRVIYQKMQPVFDLQFQPRSIVL